MNTRLFSASRRADDREKQSVTDTRRRSTALLVGTLWVFVSGLPVVADDTELFVVDSAQFQSTAQPNVLLILDTSGSMDTVAVTQGRYDPQTSYRGSCDDDRVYWRDGEGFPPTCDTEQYFDLTALVCNEALTAFSRGAGHYVDRMAQYNPASADRWERISTQQRLRPVECEDDSGLHGDGSNGSGDSGVFARNGDDNDLWSDDPLEEISWGQRPAERSYTVYEGNYINWFHGSDVETSTRLQVLQDVADNLVSTANGVKIGLMRFQKGAGGPVIHAVEAIENSRDSMISAIAGLEARNFTPLSETLYEAGQYYAGRLVDFGDRGPILSVDASREPQNPDVYSSPIEFGCQKNHIVLLTDGLPSKDSDADEKILALPGFGGLIGAGCDGSGDGACLDEMAAYLFNADLDPDLPGKQNVITHTIGFTVDLPLLATTAARGGGSYSTTDDTASLSAALANIITSVLSTQTSFTAPALSVDSFKQTQTLNDLYLTIFEASGNAHWPGNLKKYRLRASDGTIVDADGNLAIDPETGTFNANSRSFWSPEADGAEAALGGAANRLPDPVSRNVYTYLGNTLLTDSGNQVRDTNGAIDAPLLGIGNPGDPSRAELLDFIRGVDVADTNQNGNRTEPRYQMGDPLHANPVSVVYGGTPANPDVNDAVVYFSTNDGYLHAIDPVTGIEKWAFIPPEFLSDQVLLYRNEPVSNKHYGIDGSMQVQILADNNGTIEPGIGEKVYLFFGMRRGGSIYYALDVTIADSPRLMWRSDAIDLPGLGQTWSTPIPTRMNIQGTSQNPDRMVLAFGAGYDPSQDNDNGSPDNSGNAIYVIDSVSGELLWHAGSDGADRNLTGMQYSFPSDLKVIDLNGDNFADRIYASDMGGQIWRFDIFNGEPASSLMNGGIIAQLGGAPATEPDVADTRRFYYAPDIALVSDDNTSFLHVGIGSGHRAHPNSTANHDRFYALRDYNAFGARTQVDYNTTTPVSDSDLIDITDDIATVVPIGSPGWRLELRDGGFRGEKVLAEARTFNNQIFFTTFTPGVAAIANDCEPATGTNRLYVLDIFNGAPVNNLDGVGDEREFRLTDRYQEFEGSIANEAVVLFPSPDAPNCVGEQCRPPPLVCVDLFCFSTGFANDPVRTFWTQESVQ